jgi:hypothetical protein
MTRYMVIENYRERCFDKIYERFHKNGRMLPDGLFFIESWLEKNGKRCFQLMETENPETFKHWIKYWEDLVDFEIIELGEKPIPDNFQS